MNVEYHAWFLLIGALLLGMALLSSTVKRLPVSPALIYFALGVALGPLGFNVIRFDPLHRPAILLHAAEVAVMISLFTVGLKLRLPWRDRKWRPALCLAFLSMAITVGMIAAIGVFALSLPIGAAILLGAILAPTDPVLASDVQLRDPADRDRLRLTLTGEAGFNDGTAFPFVVLGLGLLKAHDFGTWGWRWFLGEGIGAGVGGFLIGCLLGEVLGRVVVHLRATRKEALGLDEYLALGLIGVSYGLASEFHANPFLSVFGAALALRSVERRGNKKNPEEVIRTVAKSLGNDAVAMEPATASAYLAGTLLALNEYAERILEVGVVLVVGAIIATAGLSSSALWFAPLLFLVIRPLAVLPILLTGNFSRMEFGCIAWFGIRGIGSVYYLMYALQAGLPAELASKLAALVLTVVASSIIVHGISGTPILERYRRNKKRLAKTPPPQPVITEEAARQKS